MKNRDDDAEDEAEQAHGQVVDVLDALGVGLSGVLVRLGHEGGHDGEDQRHAILAQQRERDGHRNGRVRVQVQGDREHRSHDAADDGVGGLGTSNRHVTDGHQLVGAANDKAGGDIAQDEADHHASDDRLIQRLEEAELVDGRDERDDEDEQHLND